LKERSYNDWKTFKDEHAKEVKIIKKHVKRYRRLFLEKWIMLIRLFCGRVFKKIEYTMKAKIFARLMDFSMLWDEWQNPVRKNRKTTKEDKEKWMFPERKHFPCV
jgi:hypothetical protein